jgi:maleate isomerase
MSSHSYRLTGPIGTTTLGLVVLQVDETIEQDFRRLFPSRDVALYVSRIPSGAELTPDTIATMELHLPQAAALLPPAAAFDAVGYACTSGTTLIGAERVAELVSGAVATRAVANPLTAAIAAMTALGVRAPAIVSPYIESVAGPIRQAFGTAGFTVPATLSFGEEVEARVARIDPASIRDAAVEVGRRAGVDAVFLSCTNLRTLDIIDDLEQALGLPVLSSNQVLAWHMARLSGAPVAGDAPGRLFRL